MSKFSEFFIPAQPSHLEDASKVGNGHYLVESVCEFDVPARQQLDDLTRLFDTLHHEKSPTAIYTKPELFFPLYSYIKAIRDKSGQGTTVTRVARHKMCHEIGERLKKLLVVTVAFLRKPKESGVDTTATEICLRSTLKMYAFVVCNILTSVASVEEEETGGAAFSQRTNRKRTRGDADAGFGDDGSGVDMDGRELTLTALVELCSPDITRLWPDEFLEEATLNLLLKMCLHMITLKQNIGGDAQPIAGALALLFARVSGCILSRCEAVDPSDLVAPLVELALKSESAALFLSRLVSDVELGGESDGGYADKMLRAVFSNMSNSALYEACGDTVAAKNVATFFSEVAKKSVSVVVKMCDLILPTLQSESYDIRKAVVTCIAEMIVQRYTGHARNPQDDAIRNGYLTELLFRIMDVNAFARNHALHIWERLVEARSVPKRYHLALMEALVGRLEDRNYLVRDSAMTVVSSVLKKNWFGGVLNSRLIEAKLQESMAEGAALFPGETASLEEEVTKAKAQFQPATESMEEIGEEANGEERSSPPDEGAVKREVEELPTEESPAAPSQLSEEQTAVVGKIVFYMNALRFIELVKKALHYASILLDSKTERDVIESIKLVVACSEFRVPGGEKAFLKVLVMVFEGEPKIQLAVRDAFAEVVFVAFSRVSTSLAARSTASAQKLISILRYASEGEVSAVDRIFGLLKMNPATSRHLSGQFIESVWGIAEGSLDAEATDDDRRSAMRIYSLLSKYMWKDLRTRSESIMEFLESGANVDNILLSYVFAALQNEALDPQFRPIPSDEDVRQHPILKHIVNHLCRTTTAMASWMVLAEASLNAIHNLCEIPVALYSYILEYLAGVVAEEGERDANRMAQFFFLLGHTALKQLVAVETAEKAQLKTLENPSKPASGTAAAAGATDSMHKELGLGSHEFRRHQIQELAQKRKQAIVAEGSLWHRFADTVVKTCRQKATVFAERPFERVCAVLALCQYMIVSETFCSKHLNLLFTIVADKRETWVTKTNIVIALGDLACVHPNLLSPYLNVPTTGFFKLLIDDDVRVRAVTIQVCSHLVLGEMLRIRDHLYTIVKLVADPDETIANNAVTFVQNLALKEKEKTGNLIPPLVTQLSGLMPTDKFQLAMRTLLERVEGDKPTDSLIDRLCQRFESFSEKSKKKQMLARNIAFCLSELNYTTERAVKRITSESCYQQYKHWLRFPEVLEYMKAVASKAKKQGRGNAERRDKTAIEEWEARMQADSCLDPAEDENEEAEKDDADAAPSE